MPICFRETLTDADSNLQTDEYLLDSSVLATGGKFDWSIRKFTLHGGLQEGVEVVEINNGHFNFAVLPTRGMSIWKARCGDLDLGWRSPVRHPVHPAFVDLEERGGIGWLRGFNEWVVRCGLASFGPPGPDVAIDDAGNRSHTDLTLHGRAANLPASRVEIEVSGSEIILRGEVFETMLFGPSLRLDCEIRTTFGSSRITINDTVSNLGSLPCEHQILYHINYGDPLLEEGSRFVAPAKLVAPRDARAAEGIGTFDEYTGPVAGYAEQAYWLELAGRRGSRETLAMLRNTAGDRASVLRFSLKDFPCFTIWKNTAAREDGYVTGLEPGTAFPNHRSFERSQERVLVLKGGESRRTSLHIEALETKKAVQSAEKEIRDLQKTVKRTVHAAPVPKLSPSA